MSQPNDPNDSYAQKVGPIHSSHTNSSDSVKQVRVDTFWVDEDKSFRNQNRNDCVITEEPMEIRLIHGPESDRQMESLYVTMRTPGNDVELALGFLFCEQIIQSGEQVHLATHFGSPAAGNSKSNTIKVELKPDVAFKANTLTRKFQTNSSCGVCGKESIESVQNSVRNLKSSNSSLTISAETLASLPESLRKNQTWFQATGGIHGCGLFDLDGRLIHCREDVGRHNAMDKLVGRLVMDNLVPSDNHVLLLSGRISFELMQKAIAVGISVVAAVGAPSSIAIDLAKQFGVTLVGFASHQRFNVYSHPERICE